MVSNNVPSTWKGKAKLCINNALQNLREILIQKFTDIDFLLLLRSMFQIASFDSFDQVKMHQLC